MPIFCINLYESCVKVVSGEDAKSAQLLGYAMRHNGQWEAWKTLSKPPFTPTLVLAGSFKTRKQAIDAITDQ